MRDHILDLAHGNPRVADALRESLDILKRRGSEALSEMARDALEGAPLRQMALSSAYGDGLGAGFASFWKKYQDMQPEERTEFNEKVREWFGDVV